MEEWRDIPSLPGYQASSLGRIRSVERLIIDSKGRRQWQRSRAGVLKLNLSPNGYLRFNSHGSARFVHHVVLEAFVGPRPDGHQAAHGDGCKTNNRADNLRWATKLENEADKKAHGTTWRPIGSKHPSAKLNERVVAKILALKAAGVRQVEIARRFGLTEQTVSAVVLRRIWAHVPAPQQSDMRAMGRVA